MYTFHAIDTDGSLFDKACLNTCEVDQFMLQAEHKYWACQLVQDLTGKKVLFQIQENGQWLAVNKGNL